MTNKLKDIVFILLLSSICIFLLLGIRSYTSPKIARYEELRLKTTILGAAGIEYTLDNFEEVFKKNIREFKKQDFVYYMTPGNFYIFEFEGRGLWGLIRGVVTLNPDLETIEVIKIISQEETPGLGGRISEESFLNQFKGKKLLPRLNLVLRRKATQDNEIDAISGATMTSAALVGMINESIEDFRKRLNK